MQWKKKISIQPQINAKHACCITDNPCMNAYYLFITWITGQTVCFSSIHKHNAYTLEEGVIIAVQQSTDLDLQYSLDFSHPCLREEPFMWIWMFLHSEGCGAAFMLNGTRRVPLLQLFIFMLLSESVWSCSLQ